MPRMILRCPNCKREQAYIPRGSFTGKSRNCVVCGKSFVIYKSQKEHNVIEFNSTGKYR